MSIDDQLLFILFEEEDDDDLLLFCKYQYIKEKQQIRFIKADNGPERMLQDD